MDSLAGALDLAWRLNPNRIWLHTSSFDRHSVKGFYSACGFVPFATAFAIVEDRRIKGTLPRDAAPQIPLIEAEWCGCSNGKGASPSPEKLQVART